MYRRVNPARVCVYERECTARRGATAAVARGPIFLNRHHYHPAFPRRFNPGVFTPWVFFSVFSYPIQKRVARRDPNRRLVLMREKEEGGGVDRKEVERGERRTQKLLGICQAFAASCHGNHATPPLSAPYFSHSLTGV